MTTLNEKVTKWAQDNFGLKLQDNQQRRIERMLQSSGLDEVLDSVEDFSKIKDQECLLYYKMVDLVTVQESYFFRDQSLFLFLEQSLLPMMIENKIKTGERSLRIWSAGSARGEEIYSIIILLKEKFSELNDWDLFFLGTDINKLAIDQAKKAEYSKTALRTTTDHYRNKYFHEDNSKYYLSDQIKQSAVFKEHNLTQKSLPDTNLFDIIICRNVIIYLTPKHINDLLITFSDGLNKTGALIVGPSDFISYYRHPFVYQQYQGQVYYRKPTEESNSIPISESTIERKSYKKRQQENAVMLFKVRNMIKNKQCQAAIEEINRLSINMGSSPLLLQYKAEAMICLGDQSAALEYIKKAITKDNSNAKLYFLKGICEMDLSQKRNAKKSFETTIALDSAFSEGYYYLAMVLFHLGQVKQGLALLEKSSMSARERKSELCFLNKQQKLQEFACQVDSEIEFYREHYKEKLNEK